MFCAEIQPSFFSSYSWNTHPFCSSPGMCLKAVTHLPPPLSPDRMISCILFQLGISKELGFCKFCGKKELNKGKMHELVLLQKDYIYIYIIQMLPILRHHLTNSVNGWLFSRQIGKGGSWRAWEMWLGEGRKGDAETRAISEKINAEIGVNRTKHRNFYCQCSLNCWC